MSIEWPVRGSGEWPTHRCLRLGDMEGLPGSLGNILPDELIPLQLIGVSYQILDRVVTKRIEGRDFLCFGTSGIDQFIAADIETGEVQHILTSDQHYLTFTNSTLATFNACVQATIESFPFYDSESEFGAFDAAARSLRTRLSAIDPAILQVEDFWDSFITDVECGDFMTEEIVEGYQPGDVPPHSR